MTSDYFVGGFFTGNNLIQSKNKSNPFPNKAALTVVQKFVGINRNQVCLDKKKP